MEDILRLVPLLRLVKMLRLFRLRRIMDRKVSTLTIDLSLLELIKLGLATAFCAHWCVGSRRGLTPSASAAGCFASDRSASPSLPSGSLACGASSATTSLPTRRLTSTLGTCRTGSKHTARHCYRASPHALSLLHSVRATVRCACPLHCLCCRYVEERRSLSWVQKHQLTDATPTELYSVALYVSLSNIFGGPCEVCPANYLEYSIQAVMMLIGSSLWACASQLAPTSTSHLYLQALPPSSKPH